MTGLETLVVIGKILIPLLALGISTGIKFLWDIKVDSRKIQEEFHNFKIQFNNEIMSLKNKIDILDGKTKDSYSKSETDNLFLKLKNEFIEKLYNKKHHVIVKEEEGH
jgi:hypothetical protein